LRHPHNNDRYNKHAYEKFKCPAWTLIWLYNSAMRGLLEQFVRFGLVGVLAAVGHYGTLIALVELAGAGPVPAALGGYVVGGAIGYVYNRRWTFDSDAAHRVAVTRFVAVAVVGFFLTGLVMALLTGEGRLHYLPAQILTTGIVMLWSFWANKLWTFAGKAVPPP